MNKSIEQLKQIQGMQTVETIQKTLKIKRSTAIKKIFLLRKQGFVETSGGGPQPRIYKINPLILKKIGNPGMYDVINKFSPIKLTKPFEHRIFGYKLTVEETLVRAVKTGNFRVILAALALFRHIKNWSTLYKYAKKENLARRIGALYDLARKITKVRKPDMRTMKGLLIAKDTSNYAVPGIKSSDFLDIQKKWGICIPFKKEDLVEYRRKLK